MKLLCIVLVALIAVLGWRVVELERYRYAASLNLCSEFGADLVRRDACLRNQETRTHWAWHLYYGLVNI